MLGLGTGQAASDWHASPIKITDAQNKRLPHRTLSLNLIPNLQLGQAKTLIIPTRTQAPVLADPFGPTEPQVGHHHRTGGVTEISLEAP